MRRVGELAPLRMIDGSPAFPEELPAPGWSELRVGSPSGMVTIRRTGDSFNCIVWGNADPALLARGIGLFGPVREAGGGFISTPSGEILPAEFARLHHILPA